VSMENARKVRHALAMSIDREGINESIMEGLGDTCTATCRLVADPRLWSGRPRTS